MSTAEIHAWQLGVEAAREQIPIVRLLLNPLAGFGRELSDDELQARRRLGHDSWAYWVRRGWEDGRACPG